MTKQAQDFIPALDEYIEPFKAVILKHIKTQLPTEDWDAMRDRSTIRRLSFLPKSHPVENIATPEDLVDNAITDDGMTLTELLDPFAAAGVTVIDSMHEQPVYFIKKAGIYAWSLSKGHPYSLTLWLSYPAYPPGW